MIIEKKNVIWHSVGHMDSGFINSIGDDPRSKKNVRSLILLIQDKLTRV